MEGTTNLSNRELAFGVLTSGKYRLSRSKWAGSQIVTGKSFDRKEKKKDEKHGTPPSSPDPPSPISLGRYIYLR